MGGEKFVHSINVYNGCDMAKPIFLKLELTKSVLDLEEVIRLIEDIVIPALGCTIAGNNISNQPPNEHPETWL